MIYGEYVFLWKYIGMIYGDLTHKIIGCGMKVHRTLRNGFPEVIYQRGMAIEIHKTCLAFEREHEITIYYEGIEVGKRRVDFFVENKIMVELKAVIDLDDSHLNQCRNYLEAYNLPVGLLINFGGSSLQYRRIYNSGHPDSQHIKQDEN